MSRAAFPPKLVVALVLIALVSLVEVQAIVGGTGSTMNYVRLGLSAFLLLGLMRGMEAARTVGLIVGALNLLGGVALVVQAAPVWEFYIALTGTMGYVYLVVPFIYGGYLLWVLTQEDVKTWLYNRAMGEA